MGTTPAFARSPSPTLSRSTPGCPSSTAGVVVAMVVAPSARAPSCSDWRNFPHDMCSDVTWSRQTFFKKARIGCSSE
ncbi:hypothetical protein BDW75DRAFT_205164 [Aspergillus navahoensis]